jgi:hypothetical protein
LRNILANYDLWAVSANLKQTALGTEQTVDTTMLIGREGIPVLDPRRETNADELTGKEEPDSVYDLGALSSFAMNFPKAQAQHFALAYAYALGSSTPAAWSTGYEHLNTPIESLYLPCFTGVFRAGKTIFKRRLADLFVNQVTSTFAKDSWAKLAVDLKGTGKYTDNMHKETVAAAYNATTFTLAANGVQGSTAAERLDSVHQVRVTVPATGERVEVVVTAVSGATPAVFTIVAPGGVATSTNYEVLYVPTEPAWATFPARVIEPPLRVTDVVLKVGGLWNGTTFLGGRTYSDEIESVEHVLNNDILTEFRIGGTGSYANYAIRQGRTQTLKLNREARDYVLQQRMLDNEYFGVYLKATGALFEAAHNYYVELVFPRCNVLKAPLTVNGKMLAEAGDLVVLEDDTYGSIRAKVGNMVTKYAAAA